MAVRAVYNGIATSEQQTVALNWIIKKAGMIGGLSYNPTRDNEIYINEGRRFVAASLLEMISESKESIERRFPGGRLNREPKYPDEETNTPEE